MTEDQNPPDTKKERLEIRRAIRNKRQALSLDQRNKNAQAICDYLQTQHWFLNAKRIGLYLANDGEIDLTPIIDQCRNLNISLSLPVIHSTQPSMHFADWLNGENLEPNRFGIAEPKQGQAIPLSEHSLVLVPLVAFDKEGNRIGMGGGYYDRFFQANKTSLTKGPLLVGVAYKFQQLDSIRAQDWDKPLDGIITEAGITAASARLKALTEK